MKIIIVGGGKVGYFLAERLARSHYVSLVEKNAEVTESIAGNKNMLVINGDGCQTDILTQAGIKECDVIAAVTGEDEDNLVICQIAKDIFKVKRTVARVNDPKNEKIFFQLGVDIAIDSTAVIAKIIEEEVSLEDMINLCAFKKGQLSLVRIDLPEEAPIVKKSLKEISLPAESIIVAVLRKDHLIVPDRDFVFQEGDEIVALTKVEDEGDVLNSLIGKM
ncbi:MAG TPA: NAD-binding protein [Candidatus Ratteibacteria bacterium]|jgi:trk system potassium uptake protein TrkA|uniref:Trk system potassium uptake protein TrkA n=1 Tax=candidate division TA06 bacterium ADurb.Bin131 TaxID=1852827 RepID=A0A1V6C5V6_UNCT6|nr:MAG: Trk system potassium uptake protein TrkA [candidate division TA06 bacterium ADurb.Bin131]HOC03573.1 NAD-binding protein [bacterium]HRS06069.1 NAD-binding protein [Candidatus Ratteibacteria bacterium]HON06061.1 NAD-binding protein [bacterium]HPC29208.1 NAD-binding protein [bacterium]